MKTQINDRKIDWKYLMKLLPIGIISILTLNANAAMPFEAPLVSIPDDSTVIARDWNQQVEVMGNPLSSLMPVSPQVCYHSANQDGAYGILPPPFYAEQDQLFKFAATDWESPYYLERRLSGTASYDGSDSQDGSVRYGMLWYSPTQSKGPNPYESADAQMSTDLEGVNTSSSMFNDAWIRYHYLCPAGGGLAICTTLGNVVVGQDPSVSALGFTASAHAGGPITQQVNVPQIMIFVNGSGDLNSASRAPLANSSCGTYTDVNHAPAFAWVGAWEMAVSGDGGGQTPGSDGNPNSSDTTSSRHARNIQWYGGYTGPSDFWDPMTIAGFLDSLGGGYIASPNPIAGYKHVGDLLVFNVIPAHPNYEGAEGDTDAMYVFAFQAAMQLGSATTTPVYAPDPADNDYPVGRLPVLSVPTGPFSINCGGALALNGFGIELPTGVAEADVTISCKLGTVTIGNLTGRTITIPNLTAAQATAALDSLVYTAAAGISGVDVIAITVSDFTDSFGSVTSALTVNVACNLCPQKPTIISPIEGTETSSHTVPISVLASDPDGYIANVGIYEGNTPIGNAVQSGTFWTFTWQNAPGGTHVITVHATDNSGCVSVSEPRTFTVPSTCTPVPGGMVGWWEAEGNANDMISGCNGTWNGASSYVGGEVGNAFSFSGQSDVSVADAPALNPTSAITVECWMKRDAVVGSYDPVVKKAGAGAGTVGGYGLEFNGNKILFWVHNGAWRSSVGAPIALGQWYHVAGVYSGTQLSLYVNGQLVGTPVSTSGNIVASSNPLRFGNDPSNPTRFFNGKVDEVSVYNRALTGTEIQSIYNAGSLGKCVGPTPPVIFVSPVNQTVTAGDTVTFSVIAGGTAPLSYQWTLNGAVVATTPTLTLNNVQLNQAGVYTVAVANGFGSSAATAVLTINPPPPCVSPCLGLVAWWPADLISGSYYHDVIGGHDGLPSAGTTIQSGKVGNAFKFSGQNYVSVADAPVLNPTSAITVEGWINRQAVVGSWDPVIKKTGINGSQTGGYSLEFSGNNIAFLVYNNGNYYGWTASASATLQLGQWYHVAGVYDGSSVRLYVNGSQVGNAVTTSGAIVPSTNPLRIGNDPSNPTTRFFNGLVDEASVYSAALTAAEIQAIYNAGSTGKCR